MKIWTTLKTSENINYTRNEWKYELHSKRVRLTGFEKRKYPGKWEECRTTWPSSTIQRPSHWATYDQDGLDIHDCVSLVLSVVWCSLVSSVVWCSLVSSVVCFSLVSSVVCFSLVSSVVLQLHSVILGCSVLSTYALMEALTGAGEIDYSEHRLIIFTRFECSFHLHSFRV